jgi:hypothetical protein
MVVGMREVKKLDLCGWDFFNHSCGLVGLLLSSSTPTNPNKRERDGVG